LRFFIDTNILISASLFADGKVATILSWILESHSLIISSYSLNECTSVFSKKFPEKKEALSCFLESIEYEKYITPEVFNKDEFPFIRDEKDLPILVSAILSDADILLTGDKDFQNIPLDKPLIFSPAQYYDLINK
jgi:putative PIN family toxin of toxin-antitoxin system